MNSGQKNLVNKWVFYEKFIRLFFYHVHAQVNVIYEGELDSLTTF